MNLTDFLLARIAEDEAAADRVQLVPYVGDGLASSLETRVLAECEAKRRIVGEHRLGEHTPGHAEGVYTSCETCAQWKASWPCPTLKFLAAVYADHPDYREDWKP